VPRFLELLPKAYHKKLCCQLILLASQQPPFFI
jgi:hypothetical protein